MKIDIVKSLIALGLSALVAYGFYTICDYEGVRWLLTILSGVVLATLSVFSLGVSCEKKRTQLVLNVLSATMFVVMMIVNLVFAFFDFSKPLFVILNGVLMLIYALVAVSVYRKQQ